MTGVWERIFAQLAGVDGVPDRLFIDGGCIKVPPHHRRRKRGGLAHGIGVTKGGRNTKLRAVCGETGRPHVLLLTPGNTHDAKVAIQTINAVPLSRYPVAGKGYRYRVA